MSVIEELLGNLNEKLLGLRSKLSALRALEETTAAGIETAEADIKGIEAMVASVAPAPSEKKGDENGKRMSGLGKVVEEVTLEMLKGASIGFKFAEADVIDAVRRRVPQAIEKSVRSALRRAADVTDNRIESEMSVDGRRYFLKPADAAPAIAAEPEKTEGDNLPDLGADPEDPPEMTLPEVIFLAIEEAGKEGKSLPELAWLAADETVAKDAIESLMAELRLDDFTKHGEHRYRVRDTGNDGLSQQNLFGDHGGTGAEG